jgi:carbon-monoxide dehydrogenase large subunit
VSTGLPDQRRFVGARILRNEDPRFLRGQGHFLDDIELPQMVHCAFLRSTFPHARVRSVDVSQAKVAPGVLGVFTWADVAVYAKPYVTSLEGRPELMPCTRYLLANDTVRHVGEAIVAVVANSRYEAEDACDLIDVDYEPLPVLVDAEEALAAGAPQLHDDIPGNNYAHIEWEAGDVDAAFAAADHVFSKRFHAGRHMAAPLETRGVIAEWNTSSGEMTCWSSSQYPHLQQVFVGMTLGLSARELRWITPDMGGGFGHKSNTYVEDAIVPVLSRVLRRPVKWIEDRIEHLAASTHAKELIVYLDVACRSDGRFLAFKTRVIGDGGSYPSHPSSSLIDPMTAATLMPGLYDIPAFRYVVDSAITNKAPSHAYRGVGWAPGHTAREVLVDEIARELELDPVELRLMNMIPDEPSTNVVGMNYDGGSYRESVHKALAALDYDGFRERQRQARAEGRYLGIGISPFVEPTAWGSTGAQLAGLPIQFYDSASVTMEPDGTVALTSGTHNHGQGHETSLAQVAADQLGVRIEDVKLTSGDTSTSARGSGTYASRTAVVAGGAIVRAATDVRAKLFALAAHMMEASAEDLELGEGEIHVKGSPDRTMSVANLAYLAYLGGPKLQPEGFEPGLTSTRSYDPPDTYANGTVGVIVEVDPGTGEIAIEQLVAVEDCGVMLNPMIVEGQVAGAIAQGLGSALLEECVYGEDGQFLSATLMDYLYPTSMEVPPIQIEHIETPSPVTIGGVKGVGEGGTISAPAAILNAIADALQPFGASIDRSPLGPSDVLALVPEKPAA